MTGVTFEAGGYRYLPGVSQYSGGVAAMAGHEIVRVRFRRRLPLEEGFARAGEIIEAAGRPLAAFCACELRSPAPFTEDGFRQFNAAYVARLESWGIVRDGVNPVARSNLCPEIDPPAEPSFHAFCFTTEAGSDAPSFVISGSGEVPEGRGNYKDHVIRPGDTSPEGMAEKARFVLAEMERRMAALGFAWPDTTASQAYTVFNPFPFFADEFVRRGAAAHGLTWFYERPPVVGLDFEMDCRGVVREGVA
jgi:hypothetical protein